MFCLNEEDEEDEPSQSDSGKDITFKIFLKTFIHARSLPQKIRYCFNFRVVCLSCRPYFVLDETNHYYFRWWYIQRKFPSRFQSLIESNCRKHFLS